MSRLLTKCKVCDVLCGTRPEFRRHTPSPFSSPHLRDLCGVLVAKGRDGRQKLRLLRVQSSHCATNTDFSRTCTQEVRATCGAPKMKDANIPPAKKQHEQNDSANQLSRRGPAPPLQASNQTSLTLRLTSRSGGPPAAPATPTGASSSCPPALDRALPSRPSALRCAAPSQAGGHRCAPPSRR